ncbi:MAG: hypothetical protein F4Z35_03395 [Dehalococcoidia bacterium]|nr:hypothetical protein [Dehalococcoidia bacterium]
MNVKEAARAAKSYIADIYSDEDISDIGLEEVEIDDFTDTWKITVGFSRPWSQKNNSLVAMLGGDIRPSRSYKVIHINDRDGSVTSLTDRILDASK